MRLASAAVLLVCVCVCSAQRASGEAIDPLGEPDVVARIHYDAGREHYVAEHYADALREFVEAYRLSNRAELLYNRARCFEELGFPDEAISCFRGHLAGTFASNEKELAAASERGRAEQHERGEAGCRRAHHQGQAHLRRIHAHVE